MARRLLAGLGSIVVLIGCGDDGGDGGLPDEAGDAGLRSDASTSANNGFVGSWSCTGTQIEFCGTGTHNDPVSFTLSVAQGSDGTLVTTPGGITLKQAGDIANLSASQTLPVEPGSVGGTWTPTYTTATMTKLGANLTWAAAGTAIYVNGGTQTCGFTQGYTCSPGASATPDAGGGAVDAGPSFDVALAGTWSYMGQFFYPDPPGTPGVDIANPPGAIVLDGQDGTFIASTSSVPLPTKGTWSVGMTTAADWAKWRQQYNYPEKIILTGDDGVVWDGYASNDDPSGASASPAQCLELFYTQAQPAGYYWLQYCRSVGTKR